jgi:hypothetical protein
MVAANRILTFTVPSTGGGPNWYSALPAGSWTAICTTSGTQITGNLPNPVPTDSAAPGAGGPVGIVNAWNGGCVDQSAGELIFCGNGGDQDYCGNEVYALALRVASPTWRRIGEPSLNSDIAGTGTLNQDYYTDGGRKSNHNAYETHFYAGRVWAYGSSSCWYRKTGDGLWSWSKDIGAQGRRGGSLTGTEDPLKPWTKYSASVPAGSYNFGACALDSTTGRIWKLSQYFFNTYRYCDVNSPNAASVTFAQPQTNFLVGSYGAMDAASVIAEDLRTWIVLGDRDDPNGAYRIGLIDVSNGQRIGVVNSTWPGAPTAHFPYKGSLMYLNGAIYLCCPWQTGGVIAKLVVPTTGTGAAKRADPAGAWTWTTLANNGTPPPIVAQPYAGSFTKTNMIRDMGDGSAAIVACDQINGPTYVYRVP